MKPSEKIIEHAKEFAWYASDPTQCKQIAIIRFLDALMTANPDLIMPKL
jgi:hypothetical protein